MLQDIQHIALNGAELGYSAHGAGSGKPPLIFTHGYAMRATGELYSDLLGLLSRDHSVYALDLRGHGASAATVADWSFENLADDVAAFAQALALDRPVFVGHSFGAVIGLLAEIRHPGLFGAIALLSPGPADHRRDPVDTLDMLIQHGHERDALRDGFRKMFVHEPGSILDAALDAVALVDADVHRAQKAQNPSFTIDDRLGEIAAPVLLVCSLSDGVVPPNRQHDMHRNLPRAKEVVFSGEGHMLAVERPAVAAGEIRLFLDGVIGNAS